LKLKPTQPCYLCGLPLAKPTNRDHYPPRQFFFAARVIAEKGNLQFKTHPVHVACNTAYKKDEDYFVQTFMPFVRGTYAGDALYDQALETYRNGHNVGLVRKVLGQFERNPSGLILPGGKTAMRFDRPRTDRVLWKIVRGLFFEHYKRVLPEDLKIVTEYVVGDGAEPPQHFMQFMAELNPPAHGKHPGVFSYRFAELPVLDGGNEKPYYFALLCWDKFLLTVFFHDVDCPCEECVPCSA
jgi:hypothetical protein